MSRRLAIVLTIAAIALMIAWSFVPADVSYAGETLRCWPASVDRSSPPNQVTSRVLACRPVATRREQQGAVGLGIALVLIWTAFAVTRHRQTISDPDTEGWASTNQHD